MRKIIGRADIENNHVIDIVIGPAFAQLAPVLPDFFCFLQKIIVDVCHILSMTEMDTFGGNAANIQSYFRIPQENSSVV